MKKILFFVVTILFLYWQKGTAQLKGQTLIIKTESFNESDKTLNFIGKIETSTDNKINIKTFLSIIPVDAITNIAVNTVMKSLKKRLENKKVEYSLSISEDNFYKIEGDSLVYQGLKAIKINRIKKGKSEFSLQLIPVFSKDKFFYKWKIDSCRINSGAFKKPSKNIDVEIKLNGNFNYFQENQGKVSAIPETKLTVYAAQKFDNQNIIESDWMPIPPLSSKNGKTSNAAYTLKVGIKETTSIPAVYKEVLEETDTLEKSLRDLLKKLTDKI